MRLMMERQVMQTPDWKGQNIPVVHKERDGSTFAILPVLEFILEYDEDTIYNLLAPEGSYGWGDSFANAYAWSQNAYKVAYIIPDFDRFGCLPSWFTCNDSKNRPLTAQGQVDRFLYLLDFAYAGLPDDHHDADPRQVAEAILELFDNMGEYVDVEVGDGMTWELVEESDISTG